MTLWKVLQDEDFVLPQLLQRQMATYAARFSVVKTPRKLVWMKSLGTVDLSLTVGAQDVDFTVAPVQAAVIMHFKVDHTLCWRFIRALHCCTGGFEDAPQGLHMASFGNLLVQSCFGCSAALIGCQTTEGPQTEAPEAMARGPGNQTLLHD